MNIATSKPVPAAAPVSVSEPAPLARPSLAQPVHCQPRAAVALVNFEAQGRDQFSPRKLPRIPPQIMQKAMMRESKRMLCRWKEPSECEGREEHDW